MAQDHDFKKGNKYAWKPGQCGNPSGVGSGRPSKNLQKIAEALGTEPHGKTGKDKDQHLMEAIYRRACEGNIRAAELYLAYRWGKPVQINLNADADLTAEQKVSAMTHDQIVARIGEMMSNLKGNSRVQ